MTKHSAPPINFPITRSRPLSSALLGLWLSGALSSLFWVYSSQNLDWRSATSAVSVLVAGLFLCRYASSLGGGVLAWDGLGWQWEEDREGLRCHLTDQSVAVLGDFQRSMVLVLSDNSGNQIWLFAQKSFSPERWLDFRRAVFCPKKSAVPPDQIRPEHDVRVFPVAGSSYDQTDNGPRLGA